MEKETEMETESYALKPSRDNQMDMDAAVERILAADSEENSTYISSAWKGGD